MSRTHDPCRLDPADLLAHGDFVRELAGRLVRDPSRADDVAQETLRAALEHPPREARPAWFSKVARAFVAREARGQERRSRRERTAARDEAVADVADTVAALEWSQLLVQTVQELPPRERDAVVRRYWHGWSAARIARAEGVAKRTVETRLQKAYQRLRHRLEDRRDVRGSWVLGLSTLAGGSARPAGWALAAGTLGNGVIAMKLWLTAAGVLALGVLAWNARPSAPEPREPRGKEPVREAVAATEPPVVEQLRVQSASDPAPSAGEAAPASTTPPEPTLQGLDDWRITTEAGQLAGIVLRRHEPVPGAEVFFKRDEGFSKLERPWTEHPDTARLRTDEQGRFSVAGLESGDYAVGVRRLGGELREAWASVDATESGRSLVLQLGGSTLSGTVRDAEGRALAGALLALGLRRGRGPQVDSDDFHVFTHTDEMGRYQLQDLPEGAYWLSVEPGGHHRYWYREETLTLQVTLALDEAQVLDIGQPTPLPDIEGRLVDRSGRRLRGPGSLMIVPLEGGFQQVPVDEDGGFRARLLPGEYRLHLTLDHGEVPLSNPMLVVEATTRQARICVLGTRVIGRLVFADGREWPGSVRCQVFATWKAEGVSGDQRQRRLQTDSSGRFTLEGLGPGPWTFAAHPYTLVEGETDRQLVLADGELERVVELSVHIPR